VTHVKHLARATLVVAALVAAVAAPQPAAAKKSVPCWTKLLNDWYDGRIDNTYPVSCYKAALKHLPDDVEVYSSARTDIQRALANAVRKAKAEHKPVDKVVVPPTRTGSGNDKNGGGTGTTGGTGPTKDVQSTSTPPTTTDAAGRDKGDGPFGSALGAVSDSADSVPVPLLILGGLAVLLVAAGVAGMIVKRMQLRRPGP
jgi:hypothetical protein